MSDFELNYTFYIPDDIEQFHDKQAEEAAMLDNIEQWVNCGNMTRDEGEQAFQDWLNRR